MGSKTSSKNFSPTILAFSPPFSSFFPSLLPPRYYFWPNAQLHLTQAQKGIACGQRGILTKPIGYRRLAFLTNQTNQTHLRNVCTLTQRH